jgi:hypothetical protein
MDGRAGVRPKVPATICWHQPTYTVRRYDRHKYILGIILHYRVDILHLCVKVCHMNERRVLERGPLTHLTETILPAQCGGVNLPSCNKSSDLHRGSLSMMM